MVHLFDEATEQPIGVITDDQFAFMQDQLEEESDDDDDYYINRATLDMFEDRGAAPELLSLLRTALGDREDMDVRFEIEQQT